MNTFLKLTIKPTQHELDPKTLRMAMMYDIKWQEEIVSIKHVILYHL